MGRYVYADNAATTQLDKEAFQVMQKFMLEEYGNASQPYAFARPAKKVVMEARECIAKCIGAYPEEIFFTSGGTESDNWALKGTAFARHNRARIVTTEIEHHAVLNSCEDLKRVGCQISFASPDETGVITTESIDCKTSDGADIISVMFANNEIGTIQNIRKLCEFSHKKGAIFHTDAVQAAGHVPINVHDLEIDLLSASGHKFNGPKGVGFLFIKSGIEIHSLISGGSQEYGLRAGTENVPAIAGMAVALERNCAEMNVIQKKLRGFETQIEEVLIGRGVPYRRNGGQNHLPGLLSLSFPGKSGEAILHRMDLKGIAISTGSACDGKKDEMSHVLRAIRLDEDAGNGTIRISLGKSNTEEDVAYLAETLASIVKT